MPAASGKVLCTSKDVELVDSDTLCDLLHSDSNSQHRRQLWRKPSRGLFASIATVIAYCLLIALLVLDCIRNLEYLGFSSSY